MSQQNKNVTRLDWRAGLEALSKPHFRRGELLELVVMERGLLIGWEERELFHYTGPETGKRFYSIADYLRCGVARRAIQWGVPPNAIWRLLNDHPEIIMGSDRFMLYEPMGSDADDPKGVWRPLHHTRVVSNVTELLKMQTWVRSLVLVDLFAILNDTVEMLLGHWERTHEEIDGDLLNTVKAIAARVEAGLQAPAS